MTEPKVSNTVTPEKVEAIKLIIVSAMMMDYGARLAMGKTEPTLNICLNAILKGVKDMENHFIYFPNVHPKFKEIFRKEFAKEEMILIAELVQTVYGLSTDSLEEIINAIKEQIFQP